MTRDLPIIFSGPMVRALLDGKKTMTRRLAWREKLVKLGSVCDAMTQGQVEMLTKLQPVPTPWQNVKPGDRLYVREKIETQRYGHPFQDKEPGDVSVSYAASGALGVEYRRVTVADAKWRVIDGRKANSIHMPRWASRITLVVTAVKIEPLWKISEADAEAEGCVAGKLDDCFGPRDIGEGWTIESPGSWASAAGMFQILWNSLHGEDAWDQAAENDTEVVALSFDVHLRNIDQMEKAA